MGYPWLLQRYLFRDLRNTFLLTSVALTGVLSLGGGVLNTVRLGDVTPAQFGHLMLLVVPVAAALTLPVAALFSAASTYGRHAADQEFVACRSAGINLHVLLLPAFMLGIVTAAFTFAFAGFVIPRMVKELSDFLGADINALLEQRLRQPRGIQVGGRFRVHADRFVMDPQSPGKVELSRLVFVENEGTEWIRYGTAQVVELAVNQVNKNLQVSGAIEGLSFYDRPAGRFVDVQRQPIPQAAIPSLLLRQVKFLTIGELLHYRANPMEWDEVSDALRKLRSEMARKLALASILEDWKSDGTIQFETEGLQLIVHALQAAKSPGEGGLELQSGSIEEIKGATKRIVTAERIVIDVSTGKTPEECSVEVQPFSLGADAEKRPRGWRAGSYGPFPVSKEVLSEISRLSDQKLLSTGVDLSNDGFVGERREAALRILGHTFRRLTGTLHERCAFSLAVVVLVVLGATLGLVFRGGNVLTAFGISFLPLVVVILTIVAGKQITQHAHTHVIGLSILWSGTALVGLLNVWTLVRTLRR
ncbi:MAG: LptF/LptG family permease [Planctomycetota bacterium]